MSNATHDIQVDTQLENVEAIRESDPRVKSWPYPPNAIRLSDYSLVGKDASLAIERGLPEATWYVSPVSKATMRELLQRRDGPAIRDTLLWFALTSACAGRAANSGRRGVGGLRCHS